MAQPVVGDGEQFFVALRRQLQFYLRTWRFAGLLAFTLAVSLIVLVLEVAVFGSGAKTASDYLAGFYGELAVDAILVAALLGGDAISMDFGSPTGYYMLVQPVRRWVLLLGRYLAAFLAAFAIGLVYVALGVFGAAYFFGVGAVPFATLGLSVGLMILFLLGALSAAFSFSALIRSPAVGMIVSVLVLFLGFSIVDGVFELADIEPWFSIQYAGQAISEVFSSTISHRVVLGVGRIRVITYHPYPAEAAAIMLGYFVLFLALALLVYDRKESQG